MAKVLSGKVAVVTGATRGIGKGVAVQLGENGATVYITGRTLKSSRKVGSLEDTAKEIKARGGRCIPVQCDHSKDDEIKKLFEKVKREQDGQLDILVNSAFSGIKAAQDSVGGAFWEIPVTLWDHINNVGLRNNYLCTWHACQLMVPRKKGLIVQISSVGGLSYMFNVPYGVGKEAVDRLAVDCSIELKPHNVASISLWPGPAMTEYIQNSMDEGKLDSAMKMQKGSPPSHSFKQMKEIFLKGETPEYTGKAVVSLAADPNVMKKTGRIHFCTDLGNEYGFIDVNGQVPRSMRSVSFLLRFIGLASLSNFVPSWIRVPRWMFALRGNKF